MESQSTCSVSAAADGGSQLISCPRCDVPLPLRYCYDGETAALWSCVACRTYVAGMFVPDLAAELAPRVRLGQRHFDTRLSPPISPLLGELVSRWCLRGVGDQPGAERRRDVREEVRLDATVIGLNANWAPDGLPMRAMVVDLSRSGLGMVAKSTIDTPLVAVQMKGQDGTVQLIAEIMWSEPVGCGFCHLGMKFVHKLGQGA